MTDHVERYGYYGVANHQHRRELDAVDRHLELTKAQVISTADLTRQAALDGVPISRTVEKGVRA